MRMKFSHAAWGYATKVDSPYEEDHVNEMLDMRASRPDDFPLDGVTMTPIVTESDNKLQELLRGN